MKPLVFKKRRRIRNRPVPRIKLHVTKGDMVQVVSGDDKGKRARVLRVFPKTGRVTLEGVNVVKRHKKATQTTEAGMSSAASCERVRECPAKPARVSAMFR